MSNFSQKNPPFGGFNLYMSLFLKVFSFCKSRDLRLHCDGARLFNAAVSCGVDPARLVRGSGQDDDRVEYVVLRSSKWFLLLVQVRLGLSVPEQGARMPGGISPGG